MEACDKETQYSSDDQESFQEKMKLKLRLKNESFDD